MGITQQLGASSLIKPGVIDNTAARPASPFEGQVIFQKDTDQLLVWNGTAWVIPNSPAQNPQGLELVKTQTIGSGVSSVQVTDAFSSTYDNYKIVVSGGASSQQTSIYMILGASTGTYYGVYLYAGYASGTPQGATINNQPNFIYAGGADIAVLNVNIELQNPFLAKYTNIQALTVNYSSIRGSAYGEHETASSYTSFTLAPYTGTLTGGTICVYGYRK
jgi:hypothetical protein